MKTYIREMLDGLRKKHADYIPPVPQPPADAPTAKLDAAPEPPLPQGLENQTLSTNPKERVRQLDFQAHRSEEEQTIG